MAAAECQLEVWQIVWRKGLAPNLPTKGLEALREALINDSRELIQKDTLVTTSEIPGTGYPNERMVACCGLAYPFWKGGVDKRPLAIRRYFDDIAVKCNNVFEENTNWKFPNATDNFISWFDNTDRDEMRKKLLPEVELELERRKMEA